MSVETRRFTFLQVSDIHLDSRISAYTVPLPIAWRRERNREILGGFIQALNLACQRAVDAVLVPGDLWDNLTVEGSTVKQVIEAAEAVRDIPLIIAPGNRDCYSSDSMYNPEVLIARGIQSWPHNVHIFESHEFATFKHPNRSDVSFTGRAFLRDEVKRERILSSSVPKDATSAINILLLHGSLEGYTGGDARHPDKLTAPFTAAELEALGFTYAALGHFHDYTEIVSSQGRLLGAYSGCMAGRSFDEPGSRYILLGSINGESLECKIEPLEIMNRRMIPVEIDITGFVPTDLEEELTQSIEEQGGRQGEDIIGLKLDGYHRVGEDLAWIVEKFGDQYYRLTVQDNTRPDYLTGSIDQRTIEYQFIETLLNLKRNMGKSDRAHSSEELEADSPDLSGPIVEDALYYGLDALRHKRISVRNVD